MEGCRYQEKVEVHICWFDRIRRVNYLRGNLIRTTEVDVRVGKINNGNAAGKDKVTGKI